MHPSHVSGFSTFLAISIVQILGTLFQDPSQTRLTRSSNAKTGGLEDDFNLTSNQYSVVLLIFFVSYVIFEIPSNLILTRVRPSLYLSGLAVAWGGIAACMAATNNWRQLAGVRFALGVIEAGFAPGIAFYLSSW